MLSQKRQDEVKRVKRLIKRIAYILWLLRGRKDVRYIRFFYDPDQEKLMKYVLVVLGFRKLHFGRQNFMLRPARQSHLGKCNMFSRPKYLRTHNFYIDLHWHPLPPPPTPGPPLRKDKPIITPYLYWLEK